MGLDFGAQSLGFSITGLMVRVQCLGFSVQR